MKRLLPILALATVITGFHTTSAEAGDSGYYGVYRSGCAESKFQTPRYNQSLPFRHWNDRRRYNAAPCAGEAHLPEPYLLKTVVVRKKREPVYTYSNGRRYCHKVLITTYKDLYSDGSCYVWTERG